MFNEFNDSVMEMQEKIFNIWFVLCLAANVIGSGLVIVFGGWGVTSTVCIICGFIIIGCYILARVTKRFDIVSMIIILPIVWIEFPLVYSFFGEVVIAYLVLGIFACTAFMQFKYSIKITLFTTILYAIIIAVNSKAYPLKKVIYNEITFLITGSAIFIVVYTMLLYYERTKKSLNEANEKLEFVACHDALTNLYTRGYFMGHLNKMFNDCHCGTLALIDIDDFKKINDTCGHLVGDEVLKFLSETITNNMNGVGIASRYGGEEIVLLFYETDLERADSILKNIAATVENQFFDQHNFKLTFSGGLVKIDDFSSIDKMAKHVDDLLYQAKRNGKNQIVKDNK